MTRGKDHRLALGRLGALVEQLEALVRSGRQMILVRPPPVPRPYCLLTFLLLAPESLRRSPGDLVQFILFCSPEIQESRDLGNQ